MDEMEETFYDEEHGAKPRLLQRTPDGAGQMKDLAMHLQLDMT